MIEVTKADGTKAITTNTEPKVRRPGPEPITTRNTSPLTPLERTALAARVKVEAAAAKAKVEAGKKEVPNAKA